MAHTEFKSSFLRVLSLTRVLLVGATRYNFNLSSSISFSTFSLIPCHHLCPGVPIPDSFPMAWFGPWPQKQTCKPAFLRGASEHPRGTPHFPGMKREHGGNHPACSTPFCWRKHSLFYKSRAPSTPGPCAGTDTEPHPHPPTESY